MYLKGCFFIWSISEIEMYYKRVRNIFNYALTFSLVNKAQYQIKIVKKG